MKSAVDPFTVEIIGEMLRASVEEMFLTLGRTALRPIIYEVLNMACGLVTTEAELIAEAASVPGFIGCLSFAVQEILDKFNPQDMRQGDVYATNDPYGDPLKRPIEMVQNDIKNGYITLDQAQQVNGVTLDPTTFEVVGLNNARNPR